MELVRKKKRVEQLKNTTTLQLPIEADMNISDTKPDAKQVIYDEARVRLEEVKPVNDKIWIKGCIDYQILYSTENAKDEIDSMNGEVPFMEEVYLDGVEPQDIVFCNVKIEQYTMKLINSRKWNLSAKLLVQPRVQVGVEEEFCTDIVSKTDEMADQPKLELQKQTVEYLENIVSKKDLVRIHEQIPLQTQYGSVDEIKFQSIQVKNISFQPLMERIAIQGELQIFVVYTQDMEHGIGYFSSAIPFHVTLPCQESKEQVLADIAYAVQHVDVSAKEDEDGVNRVLHVEMVLELEMKLWKKEETQMITGAYGITCETTSQSEVIHFVDQVRTDNYEQRAEKKVSFDQPMEPLYHDEVNVEMTQCEAKENELILRGNIYHRTFFPYAMEKTVVPFSYNVSMPGISMDMVCKAVPNILENQVLQKERDELEYMTTISFQLLILQAFQEETLSGLELLPIDQEQYDKLPGIMVHVVQKGDTLWKLGKEYYMSIALIKQINGLTRDTIEPGEKIILMKTI